MSKNRKYTNGTITVVWRPAECIHSTICFTTLRAVFNPVRRPWVDMSGADTEQIIRVVEKCPSEALTFFWNDEQKNQTEKSPKLFDRSLLPKYFGEEQPAEAAAGVAEQKPAEAAAGTAEQKPTEAAAGTAEQKPTEAAAEVAEQKPTEAAAEVAEQKPAEAAAGVAEQKPAEAAAGVAEQESAENTPSVTITCKPGNPLMVKGAFRLVNQTGETTDLKAAAFCRCGKSDKQPFCDGSHTKIGFDQ